MILFYFLDNMEMLAERRRINNYLVLDETCVGIRIESVTYVTGYLGF